MRTTPGFKYPLDCSFSSILEMSGRNFHRFSLARVIEDIWDAQARGARTIFLVDGHGSSA